MNGFPPAFAAPAAAALLALPASGEAPAGDGPALPESRLLFPAADTTPEPNDGATVQMEGVVAVVDVAPGRERSGIRFALREPFPLNGYQTVSVEVSNRTACWATTPSIFPGASTPPAPSTTSSSSATPRRSPPGST